MTYKKGEAPPEKLAHDAAEAIEILPSCICKHKNIIHGPVVETLNGEVVKEYLGPCLAVISTDEEIIKYKDLEGQWKQRLAIHLNPCLCKRYQEDTL